MKAEVKEILSTVAKAVQKNEKVDEEFLSRRFRNIARMCPMCGMWSWRHWGIRWQGWGRGQEDRREGQRGDGPTVRPSNLPAVVTKSLSQTGMSLNLEHRNKRTNDIHEGKWNGLGGKFEAGETSEECVIREVYEESGLSIRDPKLCGLLMFPNFKGNDWYVVVLTANEFTGELIDSPEGKLEWIPDEDILDLNLWTSDHIFMPWIREGKFFSAKFEYEGNEMRSYNVSFHS